MKWAAHNRTCAVWPTSSILQVHFVSHAYAMGLCVRGGACERTYIRTYIALHAEHDCAMPPPSAAGRRGTRHRREVYNMTDLSCYIFIHSYIGLLSTWSAARYVFKIIGSRTAVGSKYFFKQEGSGGSANIRWVTDMFKLPVPEILRNSDITQNIVKC